MSTTEQLKQTRDRLKDLHDILYTLAEQNAGEIRLTPPVTRQGLVHVWKDESTNEVVISIRDRQRLPG